MTEFLSENRPIQIEVGDVGSLKHLQLPMLMPKEKGEIVSGVSRFSWWRRALIKVAYWRL